MAWPRTICVVIWLAWSTSLRSAEKEAAKEAAEARQKLVQLVDSLAADAPEQAEAAYAAAGKGDLRSAYAIALIRTRHGDYKSAAAALDALANTDKRQPAILRLRLWLALELGEDSKASHIFQAIARQIGDDAIRNPERLEAVKTLAAVTVLMVALPPESAPIGPDILRLGELAVKKARQESYATTFASYRKSTQERMQSIKGIAEEMGAKDAADRREMIARCQHDYEELSGAVTAAEVAIDEARTENRAKLDEEAEPLEDLKHRRRLLIKEALIETPGKPAEPRKPDVPEKPDPPRRKDEKEKRSEREYQRELEQFRKDEASYHDRLAQYERDRVTYPRRLAEWEDKDRIRRAEIARQQMEVDAGIEGIESTRKARQAAIATQRREMETREQAAGDLWLEVGLLKSLSTGDFAAAAQRVPARPSSYKLISYSAERKRIMQLMGK